MRSGAVTRGGLQFVNGGYGLFRASILVRQPPKKGARPNGWHRRRGSLRQDVWLQR